MFEDGDTQFVPGILTRELNLIRMPERYFYQKYFTKKCLERAKY